MCEWFRICEDRPEQVKSHAQIVYYQSGTLHQSHANAALGWAFLTQKRLNRGDDLQLKYA